MTAPQLRPYLPTDAEGCADVFRLAIEVLTEEDYSEDQRAAWMAAAEDEAAFATRLVSALTLVVAGEEEGVVGFGSLKEGKEIDLLFTRPDYIRQGVGSLIMDALEKLSAARGAKAITAQVSDTALPFFTARGYLAKQRNTTHVNGEWLASTTMEKTLVAAMPPQGQG